MLILELVRPERVYLFSSVRNIRPDPSLWTIFTSVSNVCITLTCEWKRECNCQRLSLCPKLSLITWQQKKKKKILELDHSIQKSRIYLQKHPNNNSPNNIQTTNTTHFNSTTSFLPWSVAMAQVSLPLQHSSSYKWYHSLYRTWVFL